MFSFVINLDKNIKDFGISNLYFYPYLKKRKLKIIHCHREIDEELFNEVKFYIHNNKIREGQIIFILPIFEKNENNFKGNIVNKIKDLESKFVENLQKEHINFSINFITLDSSQRDFQGIPKDLENQVEEDLNKFGYRRIEDFSYEELDRLNREWIDSKGDLETIKEKINDLVKKKIETIDNSDIGKISDSSIRSNILKYKKFQEVFSLTLEYDLKNIYKSGWETYDFKRQAIHILMDNAYYFEFIFGKNDLKKIDEIWDIENLSLSGESEYELTDKFLDKIELRKKFLIKTIDEIIERKMEGLSYLKEKSEDNIYTKENNIKFIGAQFKKQFIEKYLDKILVTKKLENLELRSPVEILKNILKDKYGLQNYNYKFFRMDFKRDSKEKYNENIFKLVHYIMTMVESREKYGNLFSKGRNFYFKNINFKIQYMEDLFRKYEKTLLGEERVIENKIVDIKKNNTITYFKYTQGTQMENISYSNISNEKIPKFDMFFQNNDIERYSVDWVSKINELMGEYIDNFSESLNDYQINQNKNIEFNKIEEIITQDIEQEVLNKEKDLEQCRKVKSDMEALVVTDVKNKFKEILEKKCKVSKLKNALNRRPKVSDGIILFIVFGIILTCGSNYTQNNLGKIIVFIAGLLIIVFAIMFGIISHLHGKINKFLNESNKAKNDYLNELSNIYQVKKDYVDIQIKCRIEEKNYLLAKKLEKKIHEEIGILNYYTKEIKKHCNAVKDILNLVKNISKNNSVDENKYTKESFTGKIKDIDYRVSVFENEVFSPINYVDIDQYRELKLIIDNQEENFNSKYIYGCNSITIVRDEIYRESGDI